MTRPSRSAIEAEPRRIERCEQRLALSASLAGDLLLEALNVDVARDDESLNQSVGSTPAQSSPPEPDQPAPDLLDQAAELRHQRGLDGRGQTVAVIDSGVAWDHVALGAGYGAGYRVVGGWDFAENDSDPYDDGPAGYHGTHVSGLLAGQTDNFTGVAPGADIVALRVFDDSGAGRLEWIESALQWVHDNQHAFDSPITTVNLSVGAALHESNRLEAMSMLEDELELLRQDNVLVFAAAGNLFGNDSSNDGVLYPASSPSVTAVSSVNRTGGLSEFAQREPGIVASPGESISSTVPDHVFGWDGKIDDFARLDGTSMATPQVAGASMLLRQALIEEGLDPTSDDILSTLRSSAIEKVDPGSGATYHTIDLESAIDRSLSLVSPSLQRFDGSNDSETVELDLRHGIHIRIGELTYSLEADADAPLIIDVGGGDDSLHILGSDQAERLVAHPPTIVGGSTTATSSISTNEFRIELRGFENISFLGGGGSDRATLFDSPGSDSLTSHPSRATLTGIGFRFDVEQVPKVYAHGSAGGEDVAFLHDSAGDDSLAVRPKFTSLRSAETFQLAYDFEKVYAYATAGGTDDAVLYDSAGDDTMSISAGRSIITGPGYQVSARGFDSTEGKAISGGNDVARLYADETSARWQTTEDKVQWTGANGAVRIARGFERTLAFEQYQPVQLAPQTVNSSFFPWRADDERERAEREIDAARTVFKALGES